MLQRLRTIVFGEVDQDVAGPVETSADLRVGATVIADVLGDGDGVGVLDPGDRAVRDFLDEVGDVRAAHGERIARMPHPGGAFEVDVELAPVDDGDRCARRGLHALLVDEDRVHGPGLDPGSVASGDCEGEKEQWDHVVSV